MSAPMSREAVDETLAGLGAAHDRIAAAMFTIDSHPALAYLRGGGLSGLTETRWAALQPEVDRLWAQFAVLGDLLEQARGIRGQRRPDDADWDALRLMCSEPVVALDATGLPTESTTAPVTRVRLWDLAGQLERRCATVTGHLSDVDSSWSVVAGRYAPLTQEVDALVAQAASVGLDGAARPLSDLLAEVAKQDLGDPLSAAPGGRLSASAQVRIDGVVSRMATLRERVGALVGIRDGYPRRVAELRALVDGVAAAEERVATAYARATDRIADTGLPPLPTGSARVLLGRLADLDRLHAESRWGNLVDAADALERAATRARQRADELRDAAEGLLARRDELRGRLEAYRAKAATLGYAEDEELTVLHTRARELLYTAPCDLRAATRATFAYQQALAARTRPTRGGGDDDDR